ncbi:type II toxin-antitoxin system prevent-host-death family antitoxin [Mycolicibacterium sp. 3033]|nr:type II toxin-antitoxin system prevent-host-death family antitoxin [Mycolicibacterium aurantiacum]
MDAIGLRELRQNASELIRRVEAGDSLTVTVAGRPAALLVPAATRTWRQWADISDLFSGVGDPDWEADRELISHDLRDPWAPQ